jgi:hypothetical protein
MCSAHVARFDLYLTPMPYHQVHHRRSLSVALQVLAFPLRGGVEYPIRQ